MNSIFKKSKEGLTFTTHIFGKFFSWLKTQGSISRLIVYLLSRQEKFLVVILSIFVIFGFFSIAKAYYLKVTKSGPGYGGNYTEIIVGKISNLNPLFYKNATELEISNLIYSSLIDAHKDQIEKDLLQSWKTNKTGKIYDFVLRKNIFWQDGKKFNPEDLEFTFNILQSPLYNGPLKGVLDGVQLEILSDQEFRLTLPNADQNFLSHLDFAILPKHIFENIPLADMGKGINKKQIIGSGPYKITEIIQKDQKVSILNLDAFRKYFGTRPYIEKITFKLADSENSGAKIFSEEKNRGIFLTQADNLTDSNLKNHYQKFELYENKILGVFFNTQKAPFDNKDFREALAKAVDKVAILQKLGEENGRIIQGPILPEQFAYKELPVLSYDPKFSQNKVNDLKLTGQEIKIITDESKINNLFAEEIQKAWQNLKLKVEIKTLDSTALQKALQEKNYSVIILGISLEGNPYPYWHGSQIENGGLNLSKLNNSNIDRLLEKSLATQNPEEAKKYLENFQDLIQQEIPAIFVFQPKSYYLIDKNIKVSENYISSELDRFDKIHLWYIKTKRIAK